MQTNSAARGFENPIDYREQNNYLASPVYIAAMPFHHLLPANEIPTNPSLSDRIIPAKFCLENFSGEEFEVVWMADRRDPVHGSRRNFSYSEQKHKDKSASLIYFKFRD